MYGRCIRGRFDFLAWDDLPEADQVPFAAKLRSIGRIRAGFLPPKTALIELLHYGTRPINSFGTSEPIQGHEIDQLPDCCFLPVAQPVLDQNLSGRSKLKREIVVVVREYAIDLRCIDAAVKAAAMRFPRP